MQETVERTTEFVGGSEHPLCITRRRGLHIHMMENGCEILAESVTMTDAGKLGLSCCVTVHREESEADRQLGQRRIQEVLGKLMDEQNLW